MAPGVQVDAGIVRKPGPTSISEYSAHVLTGQDQVGGAWTAHSPNLGHRKRVVAYLYPGISVAIGAEIPDSQCITVKPILDSTRYQVEAREGIASLLGSRRVAAPQRPQPYSARAVASRRRKAR